MTLIIGANEKPAMTAGPSATFGGARRRTNTMQAFDPQRLRPRYDNSQPRRTTHDKIAAYLAAMTPGGVLSSNFMAFCEIAAGDTEISVPCSRCKGLGAGDPDRWWDVEQWGKELLALEERGNGDTKKARRLRQKISDARHCSRCNGTGYRKKKAAREAPDSMFTTVRCAKCTGVGEIENEDTEDECPRCSGDGCVVPQTVRSTGSTKSGRLPPGATSQHDAAEAAWLPPEPESEEQVTEYAQTNDLLRAIADADPESARAARLYHGPQGDKWAPHAWGRAFSIWELTAGGKALGELFLRRPELKGAGHLVTLADRIAAEREEESRAKAPDMLRRTLISKADREARVLEARMLQATNDAEARFG